MPRVERQVGKDPAQELRSQAIEGFLLHFFMNVNLAADSSVSLDAFGLSRLHHRMLVISALVPGITVGELRRALRVSHQNLNAPMRLLMSQGLLIAKIGTTDRRQRNLFATPKGRRLLVKTFGPQMARMEAAYRRSSLRDIEGFLAVQRRMIEEEDRELLGRMALDPLGVTNRIEHHNRRHT